MSRNLCAVFESLEYALDTVRTDASQEAGKPEGGFPWGGLGIGVLVVAGVAILVKFLSD